MHSYLAPAVRLKLALATALLAMAFAPDMAQAAITRCSDFIDTASPVVSNGFTFNGSKLCGDFVVGHDIDGLCLDDAERLA